LIRIADLDLRMAALAAMASASACDITAARRYNVSLDKYI
jgi:hypothetical protein